jgi:hypothetical protein
VAGHQGVTATPAGTAFYQLDERGVPRFALRAGDDATLRRWPTSLSSASDDAMQTVLEHRDIEIHQ